MKLPVTEITDSTRRNRGSRTGKADDYVISAKQGSSAKI